jgi:hypothetical protein
LVFISLPALFADAQKLQASKSKIPAEMACLGGMVRLQYVFVYPNEKDLVLAGPAEDLDFSTESRPVGKSSGRPALRLDDLVVALRTVGPGQRAGKIFGCTIDLPPDALSNLAAVSRQIGAVTGDNNAAVTQRLRNAIGNQNVRLFSVPEDTGAAYTCLEADYLLKRLALGLQKSPVATVKSYLSMIRQGDQAYNRWWFVAHHDSMREGPDGLSYEFRSKGLKVKCSSSPTEEDHNAAPGARKFAELATAHFAELADGLPSFADLWNVSDLVVLASLIREEDLAVKVGWHVKWAMDPAGYKVSKQETPRQVEPLANYKMLPSVLAVATGGVTLDGSAAASPGNRTKEGGKDLAKVAKRPSGSWVAHSGKGKE